MLDAQTIAPPRARPPLGRWLLTQAHRTDQVGELARCAQQDRGFPADGDFNAISKRLNTLMADGEMHGALDDAELDWACL
jgi:hypothetical protein